MSAQRSKRHRSYRQSNQCKPQESAKHSFQPITRKPTEEIQQDIQRWAKANPRVVRRLQDERTFAKRIGMKLTRSDIIEVITQEDVTLDFPTEILLRYWRFLF